MCFLGWALHIVDVLWTARRMNEGGYVMPISSVVTIQHIFGNKLKKISMCEGAPVMCLTGRIIMNNLRFSASIPICKNCLWLNFHEVGFPGDVFHTITANILVLKPCWNSL